MKQLITNYAPVFNPTTKQLDFSTFPGFSLNKLYAVINVTQNVPIFIAGAPGLGISSNTSVSISGSVSNTFTLQYDTSLHSASDKLNVFYDTTPGAESNTPQERGGNLEKMATLLDYILTEIKVLNMQIQALSSGPVYGNSLTELEDLRVSVKNPVEWEDLGNIN